MTSACDPAACAGRCFRAQCVAVYQVPLYLLPGVYFLVVLPLSLLLLLGVCACADKRTRLAWNVKNYDKLLSENGYAIYKPAEQKTRRLERQ